MTLFQSIVLGIIEGITEFLPISSTAHLIIAADWLKIPESSALKSFLIAIQLGAILSVAVLYAKKLIKEPKLILKIAAAFIPTSIIGLAAYSLVKNFLMESLTLIASALILGGIALIVLEKYFARREKEGAQLGLASESVIQPEIGPESFIHSEASLEPAAKLEQKLSDLSYRQAALIGVFQTMAIVPGVSRSAATIMGGLSLGVSRKNIVEFSFLLALPTMAAATFLDLYKEPPVLNGQELIIWLVGLVVAFITAVLGIKFFLRYILKNNFVPFGWYRIARGLCLLAWLWF